MKIKKIVSSELRCLSGTIKDLITMGIWILYEVHDDESTDVSYLLAGAGDYHFLSSDGKIVKSLPTYPGGLECEAQILFEDILIPDLVFVYY